MGLAAQYVNVAGAVSPGLLVSGRLLLMGFSMAETAGAVAVFNIHDGSANGPRLFRVSLLANESTREWFPDDGIALEQGLFVSRTSGTVDVTCFYLAETFIDGDEYVGPPRAG